MMKPKLARACPTANCQSNEPACTPEGHVSRPDGGITMQIEYKGSLAILVIVIHLRVITFRSIMSPNPNTNSLENLTLSETTCWRRGSAPPTS